MSENKKEKHYCWFSNSIRKMFQSNILKYKNKYTKDLRRVSPANNYT